MGHRSYHTVLTLTSLAVLGAAGCGDFFLGAFDEAPSPFGSSRPPLANAGADREVLLGLRIQLNGTGSYHPDSATFTARWTQTAGDPVVLSNVTELAPTFIAPLAPQTLGFALAVDDGTFRTVDDVAITVSDNPTRRAPRVRGPADRVLGAGDDPTLAPSDVVADPGVVISLDTVSSQTPRGPWPSGLVIQRVTGSRDGLASAPDYVLSYDETFASPGVQAPSANLVGATSALPGTTFSLNATGVDPNGDSVSARWEQLEGDLRPLGESVQISVTAPARPQTLTFRVHMRDIFLESAPADTAVAVSPLAGTNLPTVSPRLDQRAHPGNHVILDSRADYGGAGFSGEVIWEQTHGEAVTLLSVDDEKVISFLAPMTTQTLAFALFARHEGLDGLPAVAQVAIIDTTDNEAPAVYLCASTSSPTPGQTVLIAATIVDWESDAIDLGSIDWTAAFDPTANEVPLVEKDPGSLPRESLCASPLPLPVMDAPWTAVLAQELIAPAAGTSITIELEACDSLGPCDTGVLTLTVPN